jgi:hypothetical protein
VILGEDDIGVALSWILSSRLFPLLLVAPVKTNLKYTLEIPSRELSVGRVMVEKVVFVRPDWTLKSTH